MTSCRYSSSSIASSERCLGALMPIGPSGPITRSGPRIAKSIRARTLPPHYRLTRPCSPEPVAPRLAAQDLKDANGPHPGKAGRSPLSPKGRRPLRRFQDAPDPLRRRLALGADRLREGTDPQLLQQPGDLAQLDVGDAAVAYARILGLQLVDDPHPIAVDGRVLGEPL